MKDEVPTGAIIINKDGEFLTDINLVKVSGMTLYSITSRNLLQALPLRFMQERHCKSGWS